jgi:uncharacterized protein with PIN domain
MRFLLTKELGRLAKWLRILGYDAAYYNQTNAGSLLIQALRDDRIILTRNHHLPQCPGTRITIIKAETVKEQVSQVLEAFQLKLDSAAMFSRCIICNEELTDIDKENLKEKVPAYVFETQKNFTACPKCSRIYWQGTHWGNVENTLKEVIGHGIHR